MMRASTVVRRLRLATGLVLFAYLVTHYLNHALGLVSLAAGEEGRRWLVLLLADWLGSVLVLGVLPVHLGLALWGAYAGRRLPRKHPAEAPQHLLGLSAPPLV